jgi:hypothetical protein
VADLLLAIDDDKPLNAGGAVSRSLGAVFWLVNCFGPGTDEDEPAREKEREAAWQLELANRIRALGDKPITRSAFADALAKKPAWHAYLPSYAARAAMEATPQSGAKKKPAVKPATKKPPTKKPPTKKSASRPTKRKR